VCELVIKFEQNVIRFFIVFGVSPVLGFVSLNVCHCSVLFDVFRRRCEDICAKKIRRKKGG